MGKPWREELVQPCGTRGAYMRHLRAGLRGNQIDEPCRRANNEHNKAYANRSSSETAKKLKRAHYYASARTLDHFMRRYTEEHKLVYKIYLTEALEAKDGDMGGKRRKIGDTMVSKNGYHYTKVADSGPKQWRLTHHIIAEEQILGRPLRGDERVVFVNKDERLNLNPSNIKVMERGTSSKARRMSQLEARIEELQAELRLLRESPNE
jgi:hypothetical protein